MNALTLNELMHKHGINAQWTFNTFLYGVNTRSPRVFDNLEDALQAVMAKLKQHALDHEFPLISLLRIIPTPAGRPHTHVQREHNCEDI